jgi:hypothetical protein
MRRGGVEGGTLSVRCQAGSTGGLTQSSLHGQEPRQETTDTATTIEMSNAFGPELDSWSRRPTASPFTPALPMNLPFREGRDAFHCVPDCGLKNGDAVERVPTGLRGSRRALVRRILSMNRSATVRKARRRAGPVAAAGLRHSRAPVLGFKARTWAREFLSPLRGEGGAKRVTESVVPSGREPALVLFDALPLTAGVVGQKRLMLSPSPFNGERAGVRGENSRKPLLPTIVPHHPLHNV